MRNGLTILLLAGLAMSPARSQAFDIEDTLKSLHVQYQAEQTASVSQQGGVTLAQAIEQVRRRTDGRVVSAETRIQGGREVHYIKVLTKDGKVKTHTVSGLRR